MDRVKIKLQSVRLMEKYPDRVPIIINKSDFKLDKKKYLVPKDLSIGQFMMIVRSKVNIKPEESMFIFIDNLIPCSTDLIQQLYANHQKDGILYVTLCLENTFG